MNKLEQTARALLAHWDTPAWKYLKPTGDLMADLREALAEQAEQEPVAIDWEPLQNFWRNNSGVDWEELESAVKCAVVAIGKPIADMLNKDEIIRMAREAGFEYAVDNERWYRFAALVAAHEREACAKVCDDYIDRLHDMRNNDKSLPMYQPELAGRQAGAGRCAAAIRARGEK